MSGEHKDAPTVHTAEVLAHLLDPISIEEFRSKFHAKKPFVAMGGPRKFDSLFSWAALSKILNLGANPNSSLKMNLGGRFLNIGDHRDVLNGLNQGATLIYENVDRFDAKLAAFLDRLSNETGTPTRFNLYASPVGRQGYNIHYDTHDVFVLQIEGCKNWFVFPKTIEQPLYFQKRHSVSPPDQTKPELRCTLRKGELLYIPKGHWHYALAADEPSLHLTLGFFTRTGIDLLSWLVDEMRDNVDVRAELPLTLEGGTDWASPGSAFHQSIKHVAEALSSRLTEPTLPRDFYHYNLASAKNRSPFNLPSQIAELRVADGPQVFARHPHPFAIERMGDGEGLALSVRGKSYALKPAIVPLVRLIFSKELVSKPEMLAATPDVDWEAIWPFISDLMKEGVLYSADGEGASAG